MIEYGKCVWFRGTNGCMIKAKTCLVSSAKCCFTCPLKHGCKSPCPGPKIQNKPDKSLVYEQIGEQVGGLVAEKQLAYGDMIRGAQDIFKILYPDGIKPEQYDDALLVLRVMDKIGRICRGNKKAFGESPWRDICGYAILGAEQDERNLVGKGEKV